MRNKYYTGVGHRSRNMTKEGGEFTTWLALQMHSLGYTLLSGDADGIDSKFEQGSKGLNRIYLPNKSFGHYPGRDMSTRVVLNEVERDFAFKILSEEGLLPEIVGMKSYNQQYHLRNFFQSWNYGDLPEVCFYYAKESPGGVIEGGTRTAVYTARFYGIPTYNFYTEEGREAIREFLTSGKLLCKDSNTPVQNIIQSQNQ